MLLAQDPSTGNQIREIACDDTGMVDQKIDTAVKAYHGWRKQSFEERGTVLRAVATTLRKQRESLALLMAEEMGKPIREGRSEVDKAAWCAEHYAEQAKSYLAPEVIASDADHSSVRYLPLGPVLGILPWNMPVWLAFRFCAPALMAGNTCLIKPDPHTPGNALALADVFDAAGAPQGISQNLMLATPDVEAVIRDPRIQAVSFTGSSRGGAAVAAIAGSEIKHSVLELGGSDPCIVLADADLDHATDIIVRSRCINSGQSCIAAKRILIEAPIYDQMLDLITERLKQMVVGDPRLETTDVGPIARKDLRDQLHRQVTESIAQGARRLLGGELPTGEGYFYPVTLLADVTPTMTAFREETFGPVMCVTRVNSIDHAVALANDTSYGLAASIWTADTELGLRLADDIEAGQVVINGFVKTDPRLPSGGIKRSGCGRELGPHGIKEFTNAQQVWVG